MKRTLQGLGALAILVLAAAIPAKRTGAQQNPIQVGPPIRVCYPGSIMSTSAGPMTCDKDGTHWLLGWMSSEPPEPFDVPPVVTRGPGSHWVTHCDQDDKTGLIGPCFDSGTELDVHRTCKDKSRFLLMSEDGKWHCLRLDR